jgi:hypothetical protein
MTNLTQLFKFMYLFKSALHKKFYVISTVHFGIILCNDQLNAQVFKFIYLLTYALHVLGFLLAHLQTQLYNFGSGSGLISARALTPYPEYLNKRRNCTPGCERWAKVKPETCKAGGNR